MRIIKLDIPETETTKAGLQPIKMDKLGQVVLLAGKNGSGKSRILSIVYDAVSRKPRKNQLIQAKEDMQVIQQEIANSENRISELKSALIDSKNNYNLIEINKGIESYQNNIITYKGNLKVYTNTFNWQEIETSEDAEHYSIIYFVPKKLELKDCNLLPKAEIINKSNNINTIGVNYLPEGVFAKIQHVQDRWFSATHPDTSATEIEKISAIEAYNQLRDIIKLFLGTELDRTRDDEATLFGFALGKTNLSDGQKILIQFCLAIYTQGNHLDDLILFLDEPENHLHPLVIVEIIENIIKCIPNGQVWIATHSIPLLAHFDPSTIWYVEDGKVEYGGAIPEKVLSSLLGDEEEIAKLQDFISLPAQFATSRYAFESLLDPSVVNTNSSDPQTRQIRASLLKNSAGGKLKMLDYGAGKGRLLSNIFDLDIENQTDLIEKLDYIAYDEYNKDKKICELTLSKVYGSADKRYFNDMNKLLTKHNKESFDVILLCNVLHEIEPKEWITLFKEGGTLNKLLKVTGVLLLVEDNLIPTGEIAYQNGFLVLDTPELKDLFVIPSEDTEFIVDEQRDGRLKAHQIPKKYLKNISTETKKKAIGELKEKAQKEIKRLRNSADKNYKNGKLHGFWTQQLANAVLSLSES